MTETLFRDRTDAGEKLAGKLLKYREDNPLVLGIPRGGIIVGCPISQTLNCVIDVIGVRKLPIPWDPEAGFGAVAADGSVVLNHRLVELIDLKEEEIDEIATEVKAEVLRRLLKYRGNTMPPDLRNKTVILVDDGLASGYTMLAAIEYIKKQKDFRRIVAAVPVASSNALKLIKERVDDVVCLKESNARIFAVASFYLYFTELSDDDIVKCLKFKS